MKSMTGYGKGEFSSEGRKFSVEIKSVNHRYSDISIKLPRGMAEFEDPVKKRLTKEITRGKTDVYISFETISRQDISVKFNEPAADALAETLRSMKERYQTSDGVSLNILSRFQDILNVERNTFGNETRDIYYNCLMEALNQALCGFTRMRETEGKNLKDDIETKLKHISALLDNINERAPEVPKIYREKLTARINELINGTSIQIDENKLASEVLFHADRSCIDEEITRLNSHINQMGKTLYERDAVGRKLDFLAQEMNREINTIGSKANDAGISAAVVELKSELEKIREQVQNIE